MTILIYFLFQDFIKQVAFQSNANHPLGESMDYIKFEGCRYFTLTLMCDLDLIDDL